MTYKYPPQHHTDWAPRTAVLGNLHGYSGLVSSDEVRELLAITHLHCLQGTTGVHMSMTWEQ